MSQIEISKGNLVVSLTKDAYTYNDKIFTLEVQLMENGECVENDAEVSLLYIHAKEEDIQRYLQGAMESVEKWYAETGSIRRSAHPAAMAGRSRQFTEVLRAPHVAVNYVGQEAIERFFFFLNSFLQDDATGDAYLVTRGEQNKLEMLPLSRCGVEALVLMPMDGDKGLSRYEMILIDSGNTHGDSWKASFYPKQRVLYFHREDNF